jgi:NADH-quinone oxidoreductase subunit L
VSGLFHVVTHAFVKALLVLGAGAVIHALGGEQDIRKMGGLWKDMKGIAILFIIGSLALAGFPGFAGFFSKDEILGGVLVQAQQAGGAWNLVFAMLLVTAALTAFYTTRLVVLTFFGAPADPHRHVHEVHWSMTSVLAVLAALSLAGGAALGSPTGVLEHFTQAVWYEVEALHAIDHEAVHHAHSLAMALSIAAVLLGIGAGAVLYGLKRDALTALVQGPAAAMHRLVENKFYVDELYNALFVMPTNKLAALLFAHVDRALIDGFLVEGSGKAVLGAGGTLRRTQAVAISGATATMTGGAVVIVGYLLWQVTNG